MKKAVRHSLRYRIWNQSRLAMHVDDYLQVYEEIEARDPQFGSIPAAFWSPICILQRTAYQTIIVHLDMIDAAQGVSIRKLIEEARASGFLKQADADNLNAKLDSHSTVLKNIKRQRNNLVAHRSETHSFREIREQFPVSTADLRALAETYHEITLALWSVAPFNTPWERHDQRANTRELLKFLASAQR